MKNLFSILIIGFMLSLSGCGGGGESSPSSSTAPQSSKEKAYREPLTANDINITNLNWGGASLPIYPSVIENIYGTLSFRLADGEESDIVFVNQDNGDLMILNPGDVRIIVEDSSPIYESSSATYTVHVEQGINYNLSALQTTISTLDTNKKNLTDYVRGQEGSLTFELAPESSNLLSINSQTGEFTHYGIPGTANVIVTDSGSRRYESKSVETKVVIEAVNPDSLDYGDISREYYENMLLSPIKINGGDMGTFSYKLAEGFEDSDVLTVDVNTGYMTVKNTGRVVIEVTNELGDSYTQNKRKAYFKVEILQANRPDLTVSSDNFVYQPDHIIQPAFHNAKGKLTYRVESGDDAIIIDSNTRLPKIIGVGSATLIANDDGNGNYKPSSATFNYDVARAPHSGLNDQTINHVYSDSEQLRILTPTIKGQKGQLTFSGSSNVVSVHGEQLIIEHAGLATLTATDDGGQYYLPSSATLTINIAKSEHPEFKVSNITAKYSPNLCISLADANINGNKGALSITPRSNNNETIASYEADRDCFKVNKHGTAKFDVVSLESDDFLESAPQELSLVITAADSTISVETGVEAAFSAGKPTIAPPTIIGQKGTLSYRLSPSAYWQDVVDVNSQTGEMTVRNAGSTTVEVTDSGDDGYKPATTTFSVKITKAENPLSVTYPEVSYQRGQVIMPSVDNAVGEIRYNLRNSAFDVVEMVSNAPGQLEIHSAGEYKVDVTAKSSRNYLSKQIVIEGRVNKAEHPGIVTEPESFEFIPLKKVSLSLPTALGNRSFTIHQQNFSGTDKDISIDPNSGETTLLDYNPKGGEAVFAVFITEEESPNHLALKSSAEMAKEIKIVPPQTGKSTKDIDLETVFTVVPSSRNGDDRFNNLTKPARVEFAGVRSIHQPTDETRTKYGEGTTLYLQMKQVGSDQVLEHNLIRVYAQNYVGCENTVNEQNIRDKAVEPVAMNSNASCSSTGPYGILLEQKPHRFMTYTIIDDTQLGEGDWELAVPFVAYLKSDIRFSASKTGGQYIYGEERLIGGSEPTQLIEWNRINLKLSK